MGIFFDLQKLESTEYFKLSLFSVRSVVM